MAQPFSIYQTYAADAMGTPTNGVAVSSTSTYYSLPISATHAAFLAISLSWTGTPTGTFTLWATDRALPDLASDTDWVQDTTYSPSNPSGSASKTRDNMGNAVARFWRIKYVNSSGSGTLTGYATVDKSRG